MKKNTAQNMLRFVGITENDEFHTKYHYQSQTEKKVGLTNN